MYEGNEAGATRTPVRGLGQQTLAGEFSGSLDLLTAQVNRLEELADRVFGPAPRPAPPANPSGVPVTMPAFVAGFDQQRVRLAELIDKLERLA